MPKTDEALLETITHIVETGKENAVDKLTMTYEVFNPHIPNLPLQVAITVSYKDTAETPQ